MRSSHPFRTALGLALGLLALALPLPAAAEEIELDEAEVFIEWNSTDTDFGIQVFWDGEAWRRMKVRNSEHKLALDVRVSKNLRAQGLTEGFFESAEPTADELSMEEFFDRHPEGEYSFWGWTIEGDRLRGTAEFTHDLLVPPTDLSPSGGDVVSPSGFTASFSQQELSIEGEELGVEFCEVVVEKEDDEEFLAVLSVILGPGVTSVDVPGQFLEPETEYKLEVICEEESGNRTITETDLFSTSS